MRLTVLGSGTLIPSEDHRSAAHLVEIGDARLLLDCGFGTVHGFDRHGVAWESITHAALTHFHPDHVADLAPLLFSLKHGSDPPRTDPLTLLGPPGFPRLLEGLRDTLGDFVLDPGFPLEVVELEREDTWSDQGVPFRLHCGPTPHTDESVAYRVETADGAVGYTGDTGPGGGVGEFLAGVDALVCECSFPDPPEQENHLTPRGVADLARAARPGLLVLTHVYPQLEREQAADRVHDAGYGGRVVTAHDGLTVEVRPGPGARIVGPRSPDGS